MDLEVMIKGEENMEAKKVLLLLQEAKELWKTNKDNESVYSIKKARLLYEDLFKRNGYNGEYNYLKEIVGNIIEEIN